MRGILAVDSSGQARGRRGRADDRYVKRWHTLCPAPQARNLTSGTKVGPPHNAVSTPQSSLYMEQD